MPLVRFIRLFIELLAVGERTGLGCSRLTWLLWAALSCLGHLRHNAPTLSLMNFWAFIRDCHECLACIPKDRRYGE